MTHLGMYSYETYRPPLYHNPNPNPKSTPMYPTLTLTPTLTIQGPPHALTVIHSPRLSGSLLLSLTCCSPPSLLCGRNSGRLWGRSRGTTNIVIPQVILTFGLGQSNVNLLCLWVCGTPFPP